MTENMPMCPEHGTPMRMGKFGRPYCPTKNADGSWCKAKAGGSPAPRTAAPSASHAPQDQPTTHKDLLLIAALDFASRVYQGTGDAKGALEAAKTAYVAVSEAR